MFPSNVRLTPKQTKARRLVPDRAFYHVSVNVAENLAPSDIAREPAFSAYLGKYRQPKDRGNFNLPLHFYYSYIGGIIIGVRRWR